MLTAFLTLSVIGLTLAATAYSLDPALIPKALRAALRQLATIGIRLPLALLAAAFLGQILPAEHIATLLGGETGFRGILLASVIGAAIPGGPFLTFPLALLVWRSGAGEPQMVAFLASWSVFAVNRVLTYELPMLGPRFVALRLASSWMLPVLAGVLSAGMVGLFG